MKIISLTKAVIWISFSALLSCSKNEVKTPMVKKQELELRFKSDYWQVYPYIGGDGEDSVYFLKSPFAQNICSDIKSVIVKESGNIIGVPRIKESFPDKGYVFQTDLDPNQLVIWWIQKTPSEKPPADSVIIQFLR